MKENKSRHAQVSMTTKETAADKKPQSNAAEHFHKNGSWQSELHSKITKRYSFDDNGGGYLGL